MVTESPYMDIVRHYEACLARHGDSHMGVDWPNIKDAETRYRVMLDVIREPRPEPVSLLDFGCGLSHLLDYIRTRRIEGIRYSGFDISEKFLDVSRTKYPDIHYYSGDAIKRPKCVPGADYIVMNGVFTEKLSLSYDHMFSLLTRTLAVVFPMATRGIAFNVMSKHVDWERPDLFHVPLDDLVAMLVSQLSRNYIIRSDYGLYEYTVYVYR